MGAAQENCAWTQQRYLGQQLSLLMSRERTAAAAGEDPRLHSARQMKRITEGSNEGCSLWELCETHTLFLQQLLPEPQVEIFPQRELRNPFYCSPALRCFSATLTCRLTTQTSKGLSSAVKFPLGGGLETKLLLVLGTEKKWQLHAFKFLS